MNGQNCVKLMLQKYCFIAKLKLVIHGKNKMTKSKKFFDFVVNRAKIGPN